MRILGVDPGSRLTGYGCVDLVGNTIRHVTHGTLRLSNTGGKATIPLEVRLLSIYEGLGEVIRDYKPDVLSVERVFFAKNAVSALKLGQARGAVILTGMIHGLKISEYSASEVKRLVTGHGQADKDQVARMLQFIFGKQDFDTSDASDGLALAISHAYSIKSLGTASNAYAEALQQASAQHKKKKLSLAEAVGAVLPDGRLSPRADLKLKGRSK